MPKQYRRWDMLAQFHIRFAPPRDGIDVLGGQRSRGVAAYILALMLRQTKVRFKLAVVGLVEGHHDDQLRQLPLWGGSACTAWPELPLYKAPVGAAVDFGCFAEPCVSLQEREPQSLLLLAVFRALA